MNFEKIYELIDTFNETDIDSFEVAKGNFRLELEKDLDQDSEYVEESQEEEDLFEDAKVIYSTKDQEPSKKKDSPKKKKSEESVVLQEDEHGLVTIFEDDDASAPDLIEVRSPYVGFFHYSTPSAQEADTRDVVKEGQRVQKGDRLCFVSVLHEYYEILAPSDGIVKEANSEEDAFVEYNEILYKIEKED